MINTTEYEKEFGKPTGQREWVFTLQRGKSFTHQCYPLMDYDKAVKSVLRVAKKFNAHTITLETWKRLS